MIQSQTTKIAELDEILEPMKFSAVLVKYLPNYESAKYIIHRFCQDHRITLRRKYIHQEIEEYEMEFQSFSKEIQVINDLCPYIPVFILTDNRLQSCMVMFDTHFDANDSSVGLLQLVFDKYAIRAVISKQKIDEIPDRKNPDSNIPEWCELVYNFTR